MDVVGILWLVLRVALFFAASWVLGLYVFPPLYRWLRRRNLVGRTFHATLALIIALAFAELAELAGLHGILGAFLAGLFLREAISERRLSHELTELVRDVSIGFLAPIFFLTVGFEVSFGVLQTSLGLLLTVIVVATVGKIVGTLLFYVWSGGAWREGLVIGMGMNDRGAVEIILAGIALRSRAHQQRGLLYFGHNGGGDNGDGSTPADMGGGLALPARRTLQGWVRAPGRGDRWGGAGGADFGA